MSRLFYIEIIFYLSLSMN